MIPSLSTNYRGSSFIIEGIMFSNVGKLPATIHAFYKGGDNTFSVCDVVSICTHTWTGLQSNIQSFIMTPGLTKVFVSISIISILKVN